MPFFKFPSTKKLLEMGSPDSTTSTPWLFCVCSISQSVLHLNVAGDSDTRLGGDAWVPSGCKLFEDQIMGKPENTQGTNLKTLSIREIALVSWKFITKAKHIKHRQHPGPAMQALLPHYLLQADNSKSGSIRRLCVPLPSPPKFDSKIKPWSPCGESPW